jgi:hypothetical protein
VVLSGSFEGGQLFIGEDDNPVIKLIGFVQGDGGVFGPDGSTVGIILDFTDVVNFTSGFFEEFGTANVFSVARAPNQVPEGSVALLMAGGLGALILARGRRRRVRATP